MAFDVCKFPSRKQSDRSVNALRIIRFAGTRDLRASRKRARELLLEGGLDSAKAYRERLIPLVRQVMHQTRECILKQSQIT